MRIDDLNRASVAQGAQQPDAVAGKNSSDKNKAAAASGDQADVSVLAQALTSRDAERVEELRLAVESGNYNVPAEVLANSIIDSHLKG